MYTGSGYYWVQKGKKVKYDNLRVLLTQNANLGILEQKKSIPTIYIIIR